MSKAQSNNQPKQIDTIRKTLDTQQTSGSASPNSSQILSDKAYQLIKEVIDSLWKQNDVKDSDYLVPKEKFLENLLAMYFRKAKVIDEEVENIISLSNKDEQGSDDNSASSFSTTQIPSVLKEIKKFKQNRESEVKKKLKDQLKVEIPHITDEELLQLISTASITEETVKYIENEVREDIKRTLYQELNPIQNITDKLIAYNDSITEDKDKFTEKEIKLIQQRLNKTNEQSKTFFETKKDLSNSNKTPTFEDIEPKQFGLIILTTVSLYIAWLIGFVPAIAGMPLSIPVLIITTCALYTISGASFYFLCKEGQKNKRYCLAREIAQKFFAPKKFEERNSMEYDALLDGKKKVTDKSTVFTGRPNDDPNKATDLKTLRSKVIQELERKIQAEKKGTFKMTP
ncbi:MAG: hypothetical protein SFT93_03240 [Rickettsiaceae bacterium]|nr:hypothetical protein [Rickettsiaceae bacterium]